MIGLLNCEDLGEIIEKIIANLHARTLGTTINETVQTAGG